MNSKSLAYNVRKRTFNKKIEIPCSKSYANRAIILGALIGNGFKVINAGESTDVLSTLEVLRLIGLKIESNERELIFVNSFPDCEDIKDNPIEIATGDGGTTNRFLIALLSLGKNSYRFNPSERMSERPIDDLLLPLIKNNVSIKKNCGNSWIEIKGPLIFPNTFDVDCALSTQFASALKLISFNKIVNFNLSNILASESYISMTDSVINEVNQKKSYTVPIDFSSLSYPLALAVLDGEVTVVNCHEIDTNQADAIFIDILKKSGANISFTNMGLYVDNTSLIEGFDVDIRTCPDLFMTLAFVASYANGKSEFKNLEVLKHKESNRILAVLEILDLFKVNYSYNSGLESLVIYGNTPKNSSIDVKPVRDHRIVMMSYLFLRHNSGGLVNNIDCIKKSFPNFIELMEN
jgi:3-phosphoshikimate 1-carboxyvinyltransferase